MKFCKFVGSATNCLGALTNIFRPSAGVALARRSYVDLRRCSVFLQEAQLSQRDRATLLVMEYFAKSLSVTQGHSKRHC